MPIDSADAGREREDPALSEEWEREGGRGTYGGFDLKLEVTGRLDPDLIYRWVVHEGNNLFQKKKRGYRHVYNDMSIDVSGTATDSDATLMSYKTGNHDSGAPQTSYFMAIKKTWYDEDQAHKEGEIRETEQAIEGGAPGGKAPEADKTYHEASIQTNAPLNENPFRS